MMGVGAKRALGLYRSCAPRQQAAQSLTTSHLPVGAPAAWSRSRTAPSCPKMRTEPKARILEAFSKFAENSRRGHCVKRLYIVATLSTFLRVNTGDIVEVEHVRCPPSDEKADNRSCWKTRRQDGFRRPKMRPGRQNVIDDGNKVGFRRR